MVIVVTSCLLLAGCDSSGFDNDSSTTTIPAPTTAVSTTTEPPAPSTDAPTTTIDTEAQLAAAAQAYLDAFDAYLAAASDPSNPDLRAEIERHYTGPNLESTVERLDRFVERGITSQEQPDNPSFAVVGQCHPTPIVDVTHPIRVVHRLILAVWVHIGHHVPDVAARTQHLCDVVAAETGRGTTRTRSDQAAAWLGQTASNAS